jgi:hypothetical protein
MKSPLASVMGDSLVAGTEADDNSGGGPAVETSASMATWERWDSLEAASLGTAVVQYVRIEAGMLVHLINESNLIWKCWSYLSGYGCYANHSKFKNFSLSNRVQILIPFYNMSTLNPRQKTFVIRKTCFHIFLLSRFPGRRINLLANR